MRGTRKQQTLFFHKTALLPILKTAAAAPLFHRVQGNRRRSSLGGGAKILAAVGG
jgi:hypothetical protein